MDNLPLNLNRCYMNLPICVAPVTLSMMLRSLTEAWSVCV